MLEVLFVTHYYKYKVKDWARKKSEFIQSLKQQTFTRNQTNELVSFESDRANPRYYIKDFIRIFENELGEFAKDLNVNEIQIEDIWSVQYQKGDFHTVHTHGTCNLSGILYFDYDKSSHTPTHFVVNEDTINNNTQIVSPPVEEGDIVIFPSNILHFTTPNKSDKIRKVISFDISIRKTTSYR